MLPINMDHKQATLINLQTETNEEEHQTLSHSNYGAKVRLKSASYVKSQAHAKYQPNINVVKIEKRAAS